MLRTSAYLIPLFVALIGCGSEPLPTPSPEPTAISLAEWKALPIDEKYDGATLDRLRMSDPKLQNERAWNAFMAKEVIPERKRDIPGTPGVVQPPAEPAT